MGSNVDVEGWSGQSKVSMGIPLGAPWGAANLLLGLPLASLPSLKWLNF